MAYSGPHITEPGIIHAHLNHPDVRLMFHQLVDIGVLPVTKKKVKLNAPYMLMKHSTTTTVERSQSDTCLALAHIVTGSNFEMAIAALANVS